MHPSYCLSSSCCLSAFCSPQERARIAATGKGRVFQTPTGLYRLTAYGGTLNTVTLSRGFGDTCEP